MSSDLDNENNSDSSLQSSQDRPAKRRRTSTRNCYEVIDVNRDEHSLFLADNLKLYPGFVRDKERLLRVKLAKKIRFTVSLQDTQKHEVHRLKSLEKDKGIWWILSSHFLIFLLFYIIFVC